MTASAQDTVNLPSALTLLVGGDRQGGKNSAIDATLALKNNWLIGLGVDSSKIPDVDEKDQTTVSGAHFSVTTNPLHLVSGDIELATWRMSDDVDSVSAQLGLTFAPLDWVVSVTGGAEQLNFYHMPKLIFADSKSQLNDIYGGVSVEYFLNDVWATRVFYTRHNYDQNLTEYSEGLRVKYIPPSVLTTVTGFPSQDAGLEISADIRAVHVGLELAASRSALDDVRTRRAQLRASYKFHKDWKVSSMVGGSKPENSEEDPRDNRYGSLSLTYFWR